VLDVLSGHAATVLKPALSAAWEAYGSERAAGASPFAAAVLVESHVDRLGCAFAVGYPAALQQMIEGIRLPGDGYLNYLKPFRTIEDIGVLGATVGYLLGLARRTRSRAALIAELSADLLALDRLRESPPLDPRVHVELHGVYQRVIRLTGSEGFARLGSRGRRTKSYDRAALRTPSTRFVPPHRPHTIAYPTSTALSPAYAALASSWMGAYPPALRYA
jgi:hypothetical protein